MKVNNKWIKENINITRPEFYNDYNILYTYGYASVTWGDNYEYLDMNTTKRYKKTGIKKAIKELRKYCKGKTEEEINNIDFDTVKKIILKKEYFYKN
ncbi:hypothetical protein Q5M87_04855 [Brachyspira innocens]|uniref:Uncharacterized protein n=1 Tax=Brachyspira innocens TaxID=13264 RepID=A0ABT8YV62_9SPIR|nr:hypothetical protein [Brachyspira innocens]MDO6993334.1 hypothetical protein [Brachyspira innocens]MDO7019375.1 hypothetical protein [Brachyspira innocens]